MELNDLVHELRSHLKSIDFYLENSSGSDYKVQLLQAKSQVLIAFASLAPYILVEN